MLPAQALGHNLTNSGLDHFRDLRVEDNNPNLLNLGGRSRKRHHGLLYRVLKRPPENPRT